MTVSYLWEHERYCDRVYAEIERFATVVRDADPAGPVPTCPDWTLGDLVRHTGVIHRWAAAMVRDLAPRRYMRDELDLGVPDDPRDYSNWLAAGGGRLAETLRAGDPDAAMWAWGADQRVRFWSRRMLHETTVHRCDAELAMGAEPEIGPDVAVDGVDEFLINLRHAAYFAPNVEKIEGQGETLVFRATDRNVQWRVVLDPGSFTWGRAASGADDDERANVLVRGSSVDLYLLLWGRRTYGEQRYAVSGDGAPLDFWVRNSAI